MATKKKGDWYWHVHHSDSIAEREDLIGGDTMQERVRYIRTHKDASERVKRLALLTRVKNQALMNRLEKRWEGARRANGADRVRLEEKMATSVIRLHEREHPGCPAKVDKAEEAYNWMPSAYIFDTGRNLKARRSWMSRRAATV